MSVASFVTAVQSLLDKAVSDNVAPGLIASVFTPTAVVILSLASGVLNLHTQTPMTPDTTIWFASMSKQINSVVVLMLVEKMGFDINSHGALVEILPELKLGNSLDISKVLDGRDAEGKLKVKDAEGGITFAHSLDQSSGLGYSFVHPSLVEYYGPVDTPKLAGTIDKDNIVRLFESGTGWCTYWLGFFIERVTKKTLRTACQEIIFTPLGIPEHGLSVFPVPAMIKNRSSLFTKLGDG